MNEKDSILIMMPEIKEATFEEEYGPSTGAGMLLDQVPVTQSALAEFASQYNGYELDTIELHVKGAAKTGGVTKLFVGLSGEAGVKLVLKKKRNTTEE